MCCPVLNQYWNTIALHIYHIYNYIYIYILYIYIYIYIYHILLTYITYIYDTTVTWDFFVGPGRFTMPQDGETRQTGLPGTERSLISQRRPGPATCSQRCSWQALFMTWIRSKQDGDRWKMLENRLNIFKHHALICRLQCFFLLSRYWVEGLEDGWTHAPERKISKCWQPTWL